MRQNTDKFVIRMPDGMRDRIKEIAENNHRSMNAEIIFRLEESLEATRGADSGRDESETRAEREAIFNKELMRGGYSRE